MLFDPTIDALERQRERLSDAICAEAALAHVLRQMQLSPQKPLADFGGWSAAELQGVAAAYSITTAGRVIEAAKLIGKPIDANMPEPTDPRVKAIVAAAAKARNLGR
jgi:hypothetical protein